MMLSSAGAEDEVMLRNASARRALPSSMIAVASDSFDSKW